MNFRFLGTGNAEQVPCYGCTCIACQRAINDHRYHRGPCSALLKTGSGNLLIDAGITDLTARFAAGSIHTILLTHFHMDHVAGLFHLRWGKNHSINVITPDDKVGCDDLYKHPGILNFLPPPTPFEAFQIDTLNVTALPLNHSKPTVGYFLQDDVSSIAYLTDTVGLPAETERFLVKNKPTTVVLDSTHPPDTIARNHNTIEQAIDCIKTLQPTNAFLTHISHELDHYLLRNSIILESNTFIAHDGLTFSEIMNHDEHCRYHQC